MARRTVRTAADHVPDSTDVAELRAAAKTCQGCDLYRDATQTVFGAGDPHARVMLVGEQPGDVEDRRGEPFVGPAGGVLERALADADIDRRHTYVTNAVKHFKFTPAERGKRRLHKTPGQTEIVACRPWLVAELAAVRPLVLVCLGATAAKAVLGPEFRVSRQRGQVLPAPGALAEAEDRERSAAGSSAGAGPAVVATIHPSAVLRARDRDDMYAGLVDDLRVVARELA
ncbi:UdgX family uracil-DNA binding protein [Actinopolymorpha singaporensis]|uniref:Type-4 uracil-DNA glycosylase n=1 Tax=Actinopolymorpha singaporensis TaxID=117157 RepID=A0A1H1X9Z4_9ACTN|nr:UdgX family uracil-DNA binding protein [Actinopolymorpha singaporensis]SDT06115.1 DNA polymerase [Actinopolymorpha singaporensis]